MNNGCTTVGQRRQENRVLEDLTHGSAGSPTRGVKAPDRDGLEGVMSTVCHLIHRDRPATVWMTWVWSTQALVWPRTRELEAMWWRAVGGPAPTPFRRLVDPVQPACEVGRDLRDGGAKARPLGERRWRASSPPPLRGG